MLKTAAKIIADDLWNTLKDSGYDNSEISNMDWKELLDAFGIGSSDMKENIYYILKGQDIFLNDYYELVDEEDGIVYSYRKLTNAVRKELFI